MTITKETYWSVQQTEDGRGWYEIFQINDPQNEIDEDEAFTLATEGQSSILQYPQFYRVQQKTRRVLK